HSPHVLASPPSLHDALPICFRLDLRLVDLRHVIEAALETIRPAADAKDIEIEADLDGPPATVLGAADRLQQVLWNLLINAVKFTDRKSTRLNSSHLGISHAV